MNYQEFYTNIIKAPLPLRARESLGEILAIQKKKDNPIEWSKIAKDSAPFDKYINKIKSDGFLPIKLNRAKELAYTLCEVPNKPPAQKSANETIELDNISHLPVVKSVLECKSLQNSLSLLRCSSFFYTLPSMVAISNGS